MSDARRRPSGGRITVRAAGGVVWRHGKRGPEIAVVHRPRYDDWSLPKGKLDAGETELAAAVREVDEEIGSQVRVTRFVSRSTYEVASGRKSSAFWSMQHVGGSFTANDEVDRLKWLTVDAAADLLTYPTDRAVLRDFGAVPVADAVVVLVRHAKAGKRSQWRGDDDLRPLEAEGRRQARRLVPFLSHFGAQSLVSAEPVRCVQTVTPFAEHTGLTVEVDSDFGDGAWESGPQRAVDALFARSVRSPVTVVSSQGSTIPGLVEQVLPGRRQCATRKGSAWVLTVVDGTVASADQYPDAAR